MKKIILSLLVVLQLAVFNNSLKGQTTVDIVVHHEYPNQTCMVPSQWSFYVSAEMQFYSALDSADFYIDFGDGNDTTLTEPLYFLDTYHANANVGNFLQHTYTSAGNYPVVYIVTMPDGNADTLHLNAMATSSCNNVTGRLYIDANNDCIYNSGDIAIPNVYVSLDYNSTTVSTIYTDPQGLFSLSACPGYSYNLLTDTNGYNNPVFNMTCSTFNGIVVTPSPNAVQDLIADNSPTINIGHVIDSTNFTFGNCAPFTPNLFITGGTVGLSAPNDSIDLYINFGDGNDTAVTIPANGSGPALVGSFYRGFPHTYTASGIYDVLYIATGPGGISDTVVKLNDVSVVDTCGNIQGTVYLDNNGNCNLDAGDSSDLYMFVGLTYTPSGYTRYVFTDSLGHYSFDATPGNYTVSVVPGLNNTAPLTPTCPASGMTNVSVTSASNTVSDFALQCTSSHQLTGNYSLWPGIFPTYHTHIHLGMYGEACMPMADTVKFILDPLVNFTGLCDSTYLPAISGDTLTWTFNSASSFQNWRFWFSNFGCLEVIGDPSLQLGDTVCFTMIISPINGDVYPADNIITRCVPALVSLDPNRKEVSPKGNGPLGYVSQQTTFDYQIEFQNTGSSMARNIFVLDTLDADLDLSTLQIIGSSHAMVPQILPGNVLKFKFDDINLPDSTSDEINSHGWVAYRITAKPALANGTQIQNTAGIYFDFNSPVITNSTLNTIYDPASVNEINVNDASVFPNPASSTVEIKFSKETTGLYTLTDLAGKEILSGKLQGRSAAIDVSALPPGVYLLQLENEEGRSVHKIMVQH